MKKKIFFTTLAVCCSMLTAHSQKEGNIWHFGQGIALDFNSGTAAITTPSAMITFEGCASISDADGNLLFYTNGGGRDPMLSGQTSGKIWNRNHEVMYDMGNTEGGGFSAAQSSVIIPRPGIPNHYYLFTMEEIEFDVGGSIPSEPEGRGLSYFEVDMSLNGGLGGVVSYTAMALVPSYEGVCAIRHTNGIDYWIVVHNGTSGFAVLPVNAAGVGAPVLYNVPNGTGGIIKGSPDGKWLSCNTQNSNFLLAQFDASNGTVGNQLLLNDNVKFVEFSPNSKRLFAIAFDESISYYDLTASNINSSQVVVAQTTGFGLANAQMQLAPDGKIYFVQIELPPDSIFLSTITCPNTAPFLELKTLGFSTTNDDIFYGLPNFDNAIFRRDADPPLTVNLGDDQTICNNQIIMLDAGIENATYSWSTGAQTQTVKIDMPGTYAVTVTANGCGIGVDSIVISQVVLNLDAGEDLSICRGDTVQLEATGNGTLLWSPANLVSDPNSGMPFFTGDSSATLTLTASLNGCTALDSVVITVSPKPDVSVSPSDTTINAGEMVQLTGFGTGDIMWTPATGLSCTDCLNPIATPTDTTIYELTITNDLGCSATATVTINAISPDCVPEIPNAFTPNGDDINDRFQPVGAAIDSYKLTIYNRWGEEVFKGDTAWDGRYDLQDAPSEVYVFLLNMRVCGLERVFSGDVTLLR